MYLSVHLCIFNQILITATKNNWMGNMVQQICPLVHTVICAYSQTNKKNA